MDMATTGEQSALSPADSMRAIVAAINGASVHLCEIRNRSSEAHLKKDAFGRAHYCVMEELWKKSVGTDPIDYLGDGTYVEHHKQHSHKVDYFYIARILGSMANIGTICPAYDVSPCGGIPPLVTRFSDEEYDKLGKILHYVAGRLAADGFTIDVSKSENRNEILKITW